jgi:methylglutaconyl-CoA hydratase
MSRAHVPDLSTDYNGQTLLVRHAGHGVVRVILNRPDVRNAFNAEMIAELSDVIAELAAVRDEKQMRVLVLEGTGNHFCAGADLNYMRAQAEAGEPQSLRDARLLGTLFFRIASFPTTVVACVRGGAIGGGFGLVCCSDVVVCESSSVFATSEVRLGIVPGVISPYIVRKLGAGRAAPFMLSGERLTADHAQRLGLVTHVVEAKDTQSFSKKVAEVVSEQLKAGPNAARRTKELLRRIHPLPDPSLFEFTATSIALARCSDEGRHGLSKFFDKQSPDWSAELSPEAFGVPQ